MSEIVGVFLSEEEANRAIKDRISFGWEVVASVLRDPDCEHCAARELAWADDWGLDGPAGGPLPKWKTSQILKKSDSTPTIGTVYSTK